MDFEAASDAINSASASSSSSSDEGIGAARILAFKAKVRVDFFRDLTLREVYMGVLEE